MKTPEERGTIGAWAFEERARLGLSVEEIAHRLSEAGVRIGASYLRTIEAGLEQPSHRVLRGLEQLYGSTSESTVKSVDVSGPFAAAIDRQTAAIEAQTAVFSALVGELKQMCEAVRATGVGVARVEGTVEQIVSALSNGVPADAPGHTRPEIRRT